MILALFICTLITVTSLSPYPSPFYAQYAPFSAEETDYLSSKSKEWCAQHVEKLAEPAQVLVLELLDHKIYALELLLDQVKVLSIDTGEEAHIKAHRAAKAIAQLRKKTEFCLETLSKDTHFTASLAALNAQESYQDQFIPDPEQRLELKLRYAKECKACTRYTLTKISNQGY